MLCHLLLSGAASKATDPLSSISLDTSSGSKKVKKKKKTPSNKTKYFDIFEYIFTFVFYFVTFYF